MAATGGFNRMQWQVSRQISSRYLRIWYKRPWANAKTEGGWVLTGQILLELAAIPLV
jgi:hypothetical protein